LRAVGYTLDNELIAAVLLAGLPLEYGPFITSITQSLRTSSVNIDTLVSQVLDEAIRVRVVEVESGIGNNYAMVVKGKGLKCWYCGIVGHKED
jgi:hypothetical protein